MVTSSQLTDREIAARIGEAAAALAIDPQGAAISASELAKRSGMGLTPLRRFEKTGGITLRNLIALMRAMGLLERLEGLVAGSHPEPMDILQAEQAKRTRQRAPRRKQAAA